MKPGQRIDLRGLLNTRETSVLKALCKRYKDRFQKDPNMDKDLIIFLGDSEKRACWSAINKRIPTFRRNSGKFWSVAARRWLTSREKLCSLGFPVSISQSLAMGVPILPMTDINRAQDILGNSMCFSSVGIIELVALASFRLVA